MSSSSTQGAVSGLQCAHTRRTEREVPRREDQSPLHPGARRLVGRQAVTAFWDATFECSPGSRIENLDVQEVT
ncbi:hypothetical protein A5658_05370 [Mycobacterium sp. 1245111.1]|nr:hypothetical protein A5658_05370 [Mycobacterium sp. 1245111.1]